MVDPYNGAVLYEPSRRGLGLSMFGGSDDVDAKNFDWRKQQVCGTVIGRFLWHVKEEPGSLLCPDQCFDSEGTLSPRVVARPDRLATGMREPERQLTGLSKLER